MNNPRKIATDCVHAVCDQGESLDTAFANHAVSLPARDIAFCRALSYGGVRWYLAYKSYLDERLKKPFKPKDRILYAVLITALYQLDDTRHAPHAVVNEAVALSKTYKRQWASGLINALLRAYIRESTQRPRENIAKWNRLAYPQWMVQQFEAAWPKQLDDILAASQAHPPMTLRVNTRKISVAAYLDLLATHNIEATPCRDATRGITLTRPIPVEQLPGFTEAQVSVQDESAQLAVEFLDLQAGHVVLDACAAPGGKSLYILEFEPAISGLSVLDFPDRLPRLRENFARAKQQAHIIEGDLLDADTWSDGTLFDRILLDAPCTGTGVIRRHPDIKFRRQAENGLQFANNQLKLLSHAWQLLKPGGKLLYTTCSILPAENERCAAEFTRRTDAARMIDLPEGSGIKTPHGRQRLPDKTGGDGFFYALFLKDKQQ